MKKSLMIGAIVLAAVLVFGTIGVVSARALMPQVLCRGIALQGVQGDGLGNDIGMMGGERGIQGYGDSGGMMDERRDNQDCEDEGENNGCRRGNRGGGNQGGMMGGRDGLLRGYILSGFAEAFGLTVDDLQARLDAGETMFFVATSQGLTQEQFTQTIQTVRTTAVTQAVSDGVITQAQAERMLERMNQMAENGYGPGFGPGNDGCPMGDGDGGGD
jgi:hypothetical protein